VVRQQETAARMNDATQPATEYLPPPPGGLALAHRGDVDEATILRADEAARHWHADTAAPIYLGTALHKQVTAQMFRDTFNPYKPSIIDWPVLSGDAKARLVSLPIWDIAVRTEGQARQRMLSYAHSLSDPDWRAAIELNGWEEGRHKTVLSHLVAAYGIVLEPEPPYPPPHDTEWAYLATGFSECIDSFFAFGLFELAKRSGFFPEALVDTFEPVIQEECRHILLFANWLAWARRNTPWWRRPWFEARVWAVWAMLGWERIGMARGMDGGKVSAEETNFTVTSSKHLSDEELDVWVLMRLCLEENDRRFASYDLRLRRPTTMPTLARLALWVMRKRAK
jgi:hypothetical protein